MGIKNYITDPDQQLTARVKKIDKDNSLIVAVQDLKTYNNIIQKRFTNDTYGTDLNQNVTFGGAPEEVHDGTDNAYWTGTAISGTWTFDSTDQANTGTKSIDGTDTVNNSIAQLAKGASLDVTSYVAITGYIYNFYSNTRHKKY